MVGQPLAAAHLACLGIRCWRLLPQAEENILLLQQLCLQHKPTLIILAEARNFLDQIGSMGTHSKEEPFVPNLEWSSIINLGPRLATFDNLPWDHAGRQVLASGISVITPTPPLDPVCLRKLNASIHCWNPNWQEKCPQPSESNRLKTPSPKFILPGAGPKRASKSRQTLLLTLSQWSAHLALEQGLGLYYPILEKQIFHALAATGRRWRILVAGGPARFFSELHGGDVEIVPLGTLSPFQYDEILFGADLLVTDHALQLSLVRRIARAKPTLLLRQTLRWDDRHRPRFPMDSQTQALLELWLATRPDSFGPWNLFPLDLASLEEEPFFRALPKADLLDRTGISIWIDRCLNWPTLQQPMARFFTSISAERTAPEIVAHIEQSRNLDKNRS